MESMGTIGLIGGLSWYSTLNYYRVVNELVQDARGGHASASVALQSLDFAEVRAHQQSGDWATAGRVLADAGRRCEAGGADVVLICSNLMHKVAGVVADAIDVPLLHIADTVADRAHREGWSRVGVLGARWVMEEDFYVGRLRERGLEVCVPGPADRALVDRVVFDELTQGRVEPASREAYVDVVARLRDDGAQAVVLACTEIELLLRPGDTCLPLLDSMRTHAEAAVAIVLGAEREHTMAG